MKQNKQTPITTSEETIRKILREELKTYPTRVELKTILKEELKDYVTKLDSEKMELRIDEKAREYRDEILTRMDHTMGELQEMREDNLFQDHDIKNLKKIATDHHKRITALEPL